MEEMELDRKSTPYEEKSEEEEKRGKAIMVILVGVPGSGKSTFCERVMKVSSRPWARVCQDTIGNGKAGTRTQCVMDAARFLKEGFSVIIDRCNIDREQRADFMMLGGTEAEKHAVVLDLPAKLCISRSVKRTGHEGNLQGGKAAAVVNRMLQKKELPKLSEGYTRITYCQDEKEVQAAIHSYSTLGPSDTLPSGCFGEKKPQAKIQLGIMKFLKKVDNHGNEGPEANIPEKYSSNEVIKGKDSTHVGSGDFSAPSVHLQKDGKDSEDLELGSSSGTTSLDSVLTLAFPSISTADFQFNTEKASDIIVEKVQEFVNKQNNARLVLVDLSYGSKILSLVKNKAAQKNIDSKKFFTFVGDITRLYSKGGLQCNVIANAANWRLKPGGGGVNAAIFSAAGPVLETATKERAGSLAPGKALVVPLPSTSPLFIKEGVTHVIHVLGPNMNPQRPNCLNDDYVKGCKVLREAYSSLFDGFASILNAQRGFSQDSCEKSGTQDQKVKREPLYECGKNKKSKSFMKEHEASIGHPGHRKDKLDSHGSGGTMRTWGTWAQALYHIGMHPEKHASDILETSHDVVVLNDIYPKAQKHLLVLARVQDVDHLVDVREGHLQLLKTMHTVGLKWAEKFVNENELLIFRLGYHSAPSMRQLHLHVISQDFDSKHLKNKKHWNSFNSPFFRDSVDVIEEVSKHGKATIKDDESFLSMELRCNRCRSAHPNIPRLKAHITSCQAPFPATLYENGRLVFRKGKDKTR